MTKNIFRSISIILVFSILIISPMAVYGEGIEDQLYSKEEIEKDADILLDKLERIHPNLYFEASKEEVNKEVQAFIDGIDKPISDLEFYKNMAPILSTLKDGHTFIRYPGSFVKKINSSENLIPIQIHVKKDRIYIENILMEEHFNKYKDWEITSINGKSSKEIYNEIKSYVFGKQENFREIMISQNFLALYYLNNEIQDEYTIELEDFHENRIKVNIPGQSSKEIKNFLKEKLNFSERKLYEYRVLDGNIALIEFNSFSDFEGFQSFLDKTFKDINEKGINNLIIDLRANGGGNSSLGDLLVEYIYDGAYKSVSKMDIKVSKEIIDFYKENYGLGEEDIKFFQKKIGELHTTKLEPKRYYKENAVFRGDTYFLIGKNTFSSAVMLASTVKDYNIGYLIGEETGGLATHYGDIYSFSLPNTKLFVGVSHKYFTRPNGLDTGRGVLPDYYQEHIDKDALDIAIDIIKTKGK